MWISMTFFFCGALKNENNGADLVENWGVEVTFNVMKVEVSKSNVMGEGVVSETIHRGSEIG